MKVIIWLLSAINFYFGAYNFLNVLGILDSSKYSNGATLVFAVLFLCMGVGGYYFSLVKHNQKLAMWIAIGPWILALAFMFITMVTSDYK